MKILINEKLVLYYTGFSKIIGHPHIFAKVNRITEHELEQFM